MPTSSEERNSDIYHTLELDESRDQPKKKRYLVITLLIGVILGASYYYLYYVKKNARIAYETEAVVMGSLAVTVSATGNLEPTNTLNVGTEISGTIKAVHADYNDPVKKGTILAELDTAKLHSRVSSLEASLEAARAALNETEVALTHAANEYDRAQKMLKSSGGKLPAAKEVDALKATYGRARATHKSAFAQVKQAQALLQAEKDDLAKATITSPIDGIVLVRNVEPGQTVAAAMQTPILFTLAENLSQMDLVVSVDEADIGSVKEGQIASFSVDAYPDRTFNATINKVKLNSKIIDGVVTYESTLKVDNSGELLRPGMTATAEITVKRLENTLLVPNAALRYRSSTPGEEEQDDAEYVWVLMDNIPVKTKVNTLGTDGVHTAVKAAKLIPGQQIVTAEKPKE